MTIWRTAKILKEKIDRLGFPQIIACAGPEHPNSPAFLERLGLKHLESSARGEVYQWQIH